LNNILSNTTVFDTETTSKDHQQAEVIEFASAYWQNGWCVEIDELFRPQLPISPHVSAVNHITNQMVSDREQFWSYNSAIHALLGERGLNVAHNLFYDQKVLEGYGVEVPNGVCTLKMAKLLFEDDSSVEAYNLSYLRYRFELEVPSEVSVHRASGDVIVTGTLFEFLIREAINRGLIEDSISSLLEWISQPTYITVMPFGKYRGQKLVDVPLDYWTWALQNLKSLDENAPEYEPDFARSVEHALSQRV
jgi:DNA polymerase-3 subunit epsilon